MNCFLIQCEDKKLTLGLPFRRFLFIPYGGSGNKQGRRFSIDMIALRAIAAKLFCAFAARFLPHSLFFQKYLHNPIKQITFAAVFVKRQ
jgi:hypothetical protein